MLSKVSSALLDFDNYVFRVRAELEVGGVKQRDSSHCSLNILYQTGKGTFSDHKRNTTFVVELQRRQSS